MTQFNYLFYFMIQEIGCKNIIVTLGNEGAVLLQEKKDPLLIPAPKVQNNTKICNYNLIKGTVSVISSDSPCNDGNA